METKYILILIWIAFALVSGILEAFYFSKKQKHVELWDMNIHYWFTVVRIIVAYLIVMVILFQVGKLECLLFSIIMILIFPWFHDGMYYTTRELIKKGTYKLYWIDQSLETDAKYSYNFVIRTIALIAALLMFPY